LITEGHLNSELNFSLKKASWPGPKTFPNQTPKRLTKRSGRSIMRGYATANVSLAPSNKTKKVNKVRKKSGKVFSVVEKKKEKSPIFLLGNFALFDYTK